MSRRFALASLAAATLAGGLLAAPAASVPVTELPRMDCKQRIIDPAGDAYLLKDSTGTGTGNVNPVDSLDVTSIFLRLTDAEFQLMAKFKDLKPAADMPVTDTVYKYEFYVPFTDKRSLFLLAFLVNPKEPWVTQKPGGTTAVANMGSTKPEDQVPGWGHEFRPTDDLLVFTVPRAALETSLGFPLEAGHEVKGLTMKASHRIDTPGSPTTTPVDDLIKNPPAPWVVSDDSCFGPPPSKLADLAVPTTAVQFSDTAALKATLTSEAGQPIAGKAVEFKVGDAAPVSATTGADGVATASFPVQLPAGEYPVVASFAGDTTNGKSRIDGGVLNVVTEPTAFGTLAVTKPTTKTRTVTSTLLDNDKAPVAGQPVVWYVNGKKVATIVTDAKGKTVFKAAKPTQTVQAKFAGVTGKYAAANSKSVKV